MPSTRPVVRTVNGARSAWPSSMSSLSLCWESWSRRDMARFHDGECACKWASFRKSSGACVTGATLVKMARDRGIATPMKSGRWIRPFPSYRPTRNFPGAWKAFLPFPVTAGTVLLREPPDPWTDSGRRRLFSPACSVPVNSSGILCVPTSINTAISPCRGVYFRTQDDILKAIDTYGDIDKAPRDL